VTRMADCLLVERAGTPASNGPARLLSEHGGVDQGADKPTAALQFMPRVRGGLCEGPASPIVDPPLRSDVQSKTAVASTSIRKPESARAATPTHVQAGLSSPGKKCLKARPTGEAFSG
jgi:hypothetical protein